MENENPNSTAVREPPPGNDRLSSLPDFLLEDILSHLPTSAAAATAVLSNRWRHLWTRVTRLHFDADDLSTAVNLSTYFITVDSVLRRFDSFSNVSNFYFRCGLYDAEFGHDEDVLELCSSFLMSWFDRICSSRTQSIDFADSFCEAGTATYSVRICIKNSVVAKTMNSSSVSSDDGELELSNRFFCLPPCVFQSETLTELLLMNSLWFKLPESINLPNLKKLSLRLLDAYHDLLRTLFKSLPLLEELSLLSSLRRHDHVIEISAPCLKTFVVEVWGDTSRVEMLIDAPKLEHISLLCCDPLVIRFVKTPSSVHSAKLMFGPDMFNGTDPDNRKLELLKGISRVRSLVLSGTTFNALTCVAVDELLSFENLVDLTLMLFVVEYSNFDVPVWILRMAKNIKIKVTEYVIALSLLEYILNNANVLKRICVSLYDVADHRLDLRQMEYDFVEKLFMLPKASSCCEIEFDGLIVSASASLKNGKTIHRFNC